MFEMGYWKAKINRAKFDIFIDKDSFIYFKGTDGCISSKDFKYFELIRRLDSSYYFNIKV